MPYVTDRDLLIFEPNLFNEVSFIAQERVHVTDASISGNYTTSASADFVAGQVDTGSVLLIAGVPYEVITRISTTTLEISLPRTHTDDPGVPGGIGANLELIARTLMPQAELVHEGLLRLIGIDVDQSGVGLPESAVMSVEAVKQIEALGTLELAYAGAASVAGNSDALWTKASEYRRRFREARDGSVIRMDTDGDGLPDRKLVLGTTRYVRL
ncbi:MAG: hypothetical protein Kow00105_18410 [Phycisphaeraceae bacterium]